MILALTVAIAVLAPQDAYDLEALSERRHNFGDAKLTPQKERQPHPDDLFCDYWHDAVIFPVGVSDRRFLFKRAGSSLKLSYEVKRGSTVRSIGSIIFRERSKAKEHPGSADKLGTLGSYFDDVFYIASSTNSRVLVSYRQVKLFAWYEWGEMGDVYPKYINQSGKQHPGWPLPPAGDPDYDLASTRNLYPITAGEWREMLRIKQATGHWPK